MKKVLNSVSLALAGAALLTACSRPVATFQPSKAERFYTQQRTTAPATAQTAPVADVPAVVPASVRPETPTVAQATPTLTVQTQQASDALASLKATHATDKRMTKRIERAEKMLAEVNQKATAQPTAPVKKTGLAQRLMIKSMDKKIQKHLAPNETKAFTGYVRLGAIIALVGLLLLLIGNGVGATIGLLALIAGLVLVLLGVINQS